MESKERIMGRPPAAQVYGNSIKVHQASSNYKRHQKGKFEACPKSR